MNKIKYVQQRVCSVHNLVNLTDIQYLPRWVVFFIDVLILIFSLALSFVIVESLNGEFYPFISIFQKFIVVISVNIFFMYIFKTYAGIIRYSTFIDLFKLFMASACTTVVFINYSCFEIAGFHLIFIPLLGFYFSISFALLFLFRLLVRESFHMLLAYKKRSLKKRILILGIGEESIAMASAILDNSRLPYCIDGFLTQSYDVTNAKILGKPIYTKEKLESLSKEDIDLQGVLIINENISQDEMNMWVNLFLEKGLLVLKVPSIQKLRNNDLGTNIKTLQIEDLLNRKPIKLDNEEVKKRHFNKSILVTGGAGSIGSEIVRQVAQFNPSLIVVLDQAETPLYEIELEMREEFPLVEFRFVLADISNRYRLEHLFQKYNFSMVYHAAAYKHVPIIEENPHEAILVNVLGSKNLACLSSKYKVNRFVMVSTDKAVNPTNVMGASKRTAELFVQALQHTEGNITKFITSRFGNVLGSNGSVIPHFKKQIEKGGPITITHPKIVRYFMTISEACELVLQAGTMGYGGEIFVFDMGEPVKILDLAKRMIRLSGFEPDKDIKIVFTGLRPGEKLYEELLSDNTKNLPTHNKKIMISKDPNMEYKDIELLAKQLTKAAVRRDKLEVVRQLKIIVPEFKSNNSMFEVLDK